MTLNKEAFKLVGVSETEYLKWCKDNKKPAYLTSTKKDFFARIRDGRLARDQYGNLVKKRRRAR